MTRSDLQESVLRCLTEAKVPTHWADIAKHIWEHSEADLRRSGRLFYTWQYDMRWAMQRLRDAGKVHNVGKGEWELTQK
jgi:hypothetical protein